jgi:tetratricopeptide (TPR) repeat protein
MRTPADRQYAFAEGLYQQGLFDLAAGEFSKFAEQFGSDPRREAAVFNAAQCLYHSGREQREAALAALEAYQAEYSGSKSQYYWTSHYLVGEINLQRGEEILAEKGAGKEGEIPAAAREAYENALRVFMRCGELAPAQSEIFARALSRAADSASVLGDWERAAEACQKLADQRQSVGAQYMAGEALYRLGEKEPERLGDAIKAYKQVGLFGDNAFEDDAAIGVAWCLYKQGKIGECRSFLEEEVRGGLFARVDRDFKQSVSKLPEAYYLLGRCSSDQGDVAKAVEWFRLLVRQGQDPLRRDGLARLGRLLGSGLDRTTDEGAEISYAVGRSLMEEGRFAEAAAEFEGLFRLYAKMETASFRDELLCHWGMCYERLGYCYEALAMMAGLSLRSSDKAVRAKAARVEAICYQELAEASESPAGRRSRELEAVYAWRRYADDAEGAEAEKGLATVADFYYGKRMFARARSVYEEFLSRFPGSLRRAVVLFRLGRCCVETKNRHAAIGFFERCRTDLPSSVEAVFATEQLAVIYVEWSQYETALAEYSRLEPEDFPGLSTEEKESCGAVFENAAYARAIVKEEMGDAPGAASELELFILRYPKSERIPKVRLRLAKLRFDQGRYEESLRVVRPFLDEPEKYAGVGMALATAVRSSLKLGRASQAMEYARKVLGSAAGESLSLGTFGLISRIMEEAGEKEGARLPYLLLIEQKRKVYRAMITAAASARDMVEREEYVKAVDYCVDMLAIHAPEEVSALRAEKEVRKAAVKCLQDLNRLRVKTRGELRSAYWQLGELNLRMGEPAAAARAFESLAGIEPPTKQHFDILYKAGSAWKEAGEFGKAMQDFEKIVRFASNPGDNLRGQLAIGDLWMGSGDAKRSLGTYLRIVNFYDAREPAVRPWVARALLQSGVAFQKLGKVEEAGRQFEALVGEFGGEKDFAGLVEEARDRLGQMRASGQGGAAPSS